ncbi:MAG TPA: hypothetical protein VFZ72_16850, partial [Jiangellaceae bacterium]
LFSIWPKFGFYENPYINQTLPADDVGDKLPAGGASGAVLRGPACKRKTRPVSADVGRSPRS